MIRLFSFLVFVTIVVAALYSLKPSGQRAAGTVEGLPWQIELLPGGRSRVFGVTLGQDTLGDARARLGDDMSLAIIASPGQDDDALEMFYSHYTAGVFSGRLVLAARLPPEALARLKARALRAEYTDTGARKFIPDPDDLPVALRAPVAGITFIPVVGIDEAAAVARFGKPAEVLRIDDRVSHLLYPAKGLDVVIDKKGREVLQYVAPRDFDRLLRPAASTTAGPQ